MVIVRQSTAFETAIGPFLDADGVAVTGMVVGDLKLKKTSGNFAALNGSATLTHVSAGVYDLVLTTSDTDTVGVCAVAADDTVNTCATLYLQVVEEAVFDMLYSASAVGYITDQPVNATKFSGSATAADNAEVIFDTDFADTYNTTANKWEVDLTHSLGVAVQPCDFTIASATSTTVTLPTTYQDGATGLPDDDRYIWTAIKVVGGTGEGQVVLLTTAGASARQYNVLSGSMPVELDNTSRCDVLGKWQVNTTHVGGTVQTANDVGADVDAILDDTGTSGVALANDSITASKIANGAIDAATFAADVDAEILSYLVDDATRIDASALNTASGTTIPAIVADTNELQADWANGGRLDLLIDGIKAKTDGMVFTVTGYLDCNVLRFRGLELPADPFP